jgi:3-methyladenine DNA glycosylase AlkD
VTGRTASTPLARAVLERVTAELTPLADPVRAVPMRAYMRDQFAFLGIPNPVRAPAFRAAIEGTAVPSAADLDALARLAWQQDAREHQYFALWYLRRHRSRLEPSFIATARHLTVTKSWWDTVDELAQNIVGPLVLAHPDLVAVMDEWIDDENIWLARTALLHQDRFKAATDPERLFRYCERRASDTEFFIRKAIGWALREYSKTDADAVRAFVRDHEDQLSGLSRREALKWLDRRAARTPTIS